MGEGENPTKEQLKKLAQKYGVKKGSDIIGEVRESTEKWKVFAKEAGVSQKSRERINTVLKAL